MASTTNTTLTAPSPASCDPASRTAADAARAATAAWRPATAFPSVVHLELLAAALIPDPFVDLNENITQWVGEADWEYRCVFSLSQSDLDAVARAECLDLVFEGLDTIATVSLNGVEIAKVDNMFVSTRVSLHRDQLAAAGQQNTLHIHFKSAYNEGKEREAVHGTRSVWNGDASRVYVRKAQYHWGWDWGPVTITCGPWRPISLQAYSARIDNLDAHVDVADDLQSATVSCSADVVAPSPDQWQVDFELVSPQGDVCGSACAAATGAGKAAHKFTLATPQLWWPVGHGSQPLYTVRAKLVHAETKAFDSNAVAKRIGVRRLRLVEDAIAGTPKPSTTFYFEVNKKPVFCAGSNWIPADSFTPRITDETYRKWLQLAVNGNQNMIRVWGGGLYEGDAFYDLCDEMGLLVWQDFMFACGAYPAHAEFCASVELEARQQVARLRHHPCIAIFTGNNEDYAFAESYDLGYDPNSNDEKQWKESKFPARLIYERILPKVVNELWPGIPYRAGSPWSPDGRNSADTFVGDIHQWNVWHGTQEAYQNYKNLSGRFVSEFGMQGYPVLKTVKSFFGSNGEAEIHPTCLVVDHHNKATGFLRRIGSYLYENIRFSMKMHDYIYGSQLIQAEALLYAYRGWRRQWTSEVRGVSGALVWQINDCWPVVSWAIVDYRFNPKPAYFAIKREIAPISLGMERTGGFTSVTSGEGKVVAKATAPREMHVWGSNFTDTPVEGTLVVTFFNVSEADEAKQVALEVRHAVTLRANSATELPTIEFPGDRDRDVYVAAARLEGGGKVLARTAEWPQPLRHLPYPTREPSLQVTVSEAERVVRLSAKRPVKGAWVEPAAGGAAGSEGTHVLADNFVDVFPGDEVIIPIVSGEKWGEGVSVRFLGDWEL
ncbi:glycoside hydrolase family 2 protein [Zopfochytrium polystomum]|nr:glycoside hydrolase family 2 protein [Zopfochytrium polystomum]